MTIEEFRNFGWKAGMEVRLRNSEGGLYHAEILAVWFHGDEIWTPREKPVTAAEIVSILNPDGTVAWRAK